MSTRAPHIPIKFSVVIPVYNGSATIARTIRSVLAQSYHNYELIVVDDKSTDDSVNLIENEFGGQLQLISKQVNQGSSAARNDGMNAATGHYIAFLDADDAWHKDKLMLIKIALEANPSIALLFHPYTLSEINTIALPADLSVYKVQFKKLLAGNFISTSCLTIRNDPAFRFEPTMRYTEDFDLCLRIGYRHGIYLIDIPLTQLFRSIMSTGGISANKWGMRKGELRAYTKLPKLNPLFAIPLPFLLLYSLSKHVYKMMISK